MLAADIGPPEGVLTIVTGLPRSGTSMLMQMLAAAGVPLLHDEIRQPDAHNPQGYFEYEPVKRLHADVSWLPAARGRALKVVAPLVPALPTSERYRFVLMQRPIDEVLESQRHMLGQESGGEALLMRALEKSLPLAERHIRDTLRAPMLSLDYAKTIASPDAAARTLAEFLGPPFNAQAAARAANPKLYRTRR
jgi:hypothetical protein